MAAEDLKEWRRHTEQVDDASGGTCHGRCTSVHVASFGTFQHTMLHTRSGPLVVLGGFEGQLTSQTKDHRHLHKNSSNFSHFPSVWTDFWETSRAKMCQIKTVVKLENHFNAGIR